MARWISMCARHPIRVVVAYLLMTLVAAIGAMRVEPEDDVFVFLPEQDTDVERFRSASERFGALRVALVGVRVPASEPDVFGPEPLRALMAATKALESAEAVDRVMSLTNVEDVVISEGGAEIGPLVAALPRDVNERSRLRARVLALDHIVGNLVSRDAKAATLMIHVVEGIGTERIVRSIRDAVEPALVGYEVFYAGGPFAAEAIYGEAREDVKRLSPVAAVVLVAVVLLSFRDPVGVALTLWTVAFSTLATFGIMGFAGERYTALTSTMPVLLLATGSSYAVHVLGRYYLERERQTPDRALERVGQIVGAPLAIAAWTTSAAFLSFLVMDVRPMRAFGLEVAFGTLTCWFTAITFVPAVLALWPRPPQPERLLPFGRVLAASWRWLATHPRWTMGVLAMVTAFAMLPLGDVRVRMEAQAFFRPGSDAWRAQQFFEDTFGGARFVQVELTGDLDDPATIREVARLVDYSRTLPGVTQVSSVVEPLLIGSDVLGGGYRLPSSRKQAAQIYLFVEGQTGFSSLLTSDHHGALVNIRVRGASDAVVTALETWIDRDFRRNPPPPHQRDVIERLGFVVDAYGGRISFAVLEPLVQSRLSPTDTRDEALRRTRIARGLEQFLAGEFAPPLVPADVELLRQAAAQSRGALRALVRTNVATGADPDSWREVATALDELEREAATDDVVASVLARSGLSAHDASLRRRLAMVVADLFAKDIGPAPVPLAGQVTGEPLLDRALSKSVAANQMRSMVIGLLTVTLLLVVLFRSWVLAVVCVVPALLTAVWIGGAMGFLGLDIDLSTAMVGAILTDTASDLSMHYVWYLRLEPPERVARKVGPIVVISTVLVAAGFFVFSLGGSTVLRTFGILSGVTCLVSGVITLLVLPTAWRWLQRRNTAIPRDEAPETTSGISRATNPVGRSAGRSEPR